MTEQADCPPGMSQGTDPPLPFRKRGIYLVMMVTGVIVALVLMWMVRWVLTLTFAAILLAVFLRTGADLLARGLGRFVKIGPGQSLALFGVLLIIAGAVFVVTAVPGLMTQFNELRQQLPKAVDELQDEIRDTEWGAWVLEALPAITGGEDPQEQRQGQGQGQGQGQESGGEGRRQEGGEEPVPGSWSEPGPAGPAPGTQGNAQQGDGETGQRENRDQEDEDEDEEPSLADVVTPQPQAVARHAATAMGAVITFFVAILFFLFTGIYLAADPDLYKRGILWLIPPRGRKKADCVLTRVGRTLQYWLMGQLVAMAAVGVLVGIGLWILGAPLPLVSGVLAALLEFIPNLGPVVAGGVPTLLSFTTEGRFFDRSTLALAVVILFLAVQALESYIITPLVQQRAVDLPPALLIFTQLASAFVLGPVGVIIAAPLVASIMAAARELLVVGEPGKEHPKDRSHEGDKK